MNKKLSKRLVISKRAGDHSPYCGNVGGPLSARAQSDVKLDDDEKKVFDLFRSTIKKFKLRTTVRVAGGWVRDKLMNKGSKDIDIAVDNMMGKEFANYVDMYARSQGIKISTGIIPAKPEQGKNMETAVIHVFDQEIEVVNLRDEEYDEKSRTPVTVLTDSPIRDAYRRDFTINSLFYNINSNQVEDFTGKGIADIKNHTLRTPVPPPEIWDELGITSEDEAITPRKTFMDDPLRVLRAIRFANRYGFNVDPELADAAKDPDVQDAFRQKISRERIEIELRKIMSEHKSPRLALELIKDWGYRSEVLQLPDEYEEWELDQNSPSHELTVWGHLMEALDNIYEITKSKDISRADRYILNWSTFLHDVGKLDPSIRGTKQVGDQINSTFHGHEECSMKAAEYLLRNLPGTRVEEIERIKILIDAARRMNPQHQDPEEIANIKNKTLGKILRLTNRFKQDWERALEVAMADSSAHKKDWVSNYPRTYWDSLKQKFEDMPKETATMGPLLSGNDLMQLFDRTGGPWLGKLNSHIIEWQMENPGATKEQVADFARQAYQSLGLEKMSSMLSKRDTPISKLAIEELSTYKDPPAEIENKTAVSKNMISVRAIEQSDKPAYKEKKKIHDDYSRHKGIPEMREYAAISSRAGGVSSIHSIPQDIDAKLRSLPGFHTYKAEERRHISYKGKIPVDGDQNISINWVFSFNVVPTIHINKDDDKLLEQLGLSSEVLEKSTGANTKQIFLSSVSVSKEIYSKEDFELNMGELDNPSARIGRSPICKTAEEAFKYLYNTLYGSDFREKFDYAIKEVFRERDEHKEGFDSVLNSDVSEEFWTDENRERIFGDDGVERPIQFYRPPDLKDEPEQEAMDKVAISSRAGSSGLDRATILSEKDPVAFFELGLDGHFPELTSKTKDSVNRLVSDRPGLLYELKHSESKVLIGIYEDQSKYREMLEYIGVTPMKPSIRDKNDNSCPSCGNEMSIDIGKHNDEYRVTKGCNDCGPYSVRSFDSKEEAEKYLGKRASLISVRSNDVALYKKTTYGDANTKMISKRAKVTSDTPAYKKKEKSEEGNTIYRYDEKHVEKRWKEKKEKLKKLEKNLKKVREKYQRDLTSDNEKTRATAAIVGIMDDTAMRIGNEDSAKEGTYGATTLKVKHVKGGSGNITFDFPGKGAIEQNVVLKNNKVIKVVRDLMKGKKKDDFIFEIDGKKIWDRTVNRYLEEFGISAKDIRGFHANRLMKEQLKKKDFKEALKEVAEIVGHEESTLKNQYLDPELVEKHEGKGKDKDGDKKKKASISVRADDFTTKQTPTIEKTIKDTLSDNPKYGPDAQTEYQPTPPAPTPAPVAPVPVVNTSLNVGNVHKSSKAKGMLVIAWRILAPFLPPGARLRNSNRTWNDQKIIIRNYWANKRWKTVDKERKQFDAPAGTGFFATTFPKIANIDGSANTRTPSVERELEKAREFMTSTYNPKEKVTINGEERPVWHAGGPWNKLKIAWTGSNHIGGNAIDIDDAPLEEIKRAVGYVMGEPTLAPFIRISGTVYESDQGNFHVNISGATAIPKEIHEAALRNYIHGTPIGPETMVAKGNLLSKRAELDEEDMKWVESIKPAVSSRAPSRVPAQTGTNTKTIDVQQDVKKSVNIGKNVRLNNLVINAWMTLRPFLPSGAKMTSGFRTPEDQKRILNNYWVKATGKEVEANADNRTWRQISVLLKRHHGYIVGPPDAKPRYGHLSGNAIDVSGADLDTIAETVKMITSDKNIPVNFRKPLVEYKNNAVHIGIESATYDKVAISQALKQHRAVASISVRASDEADAVRQISDIHDDLLASNPPDSVVRDFEEAFGMQRCASDPWFEEMGFGVDDMQGDWFEKSPIFRYREEEDVPEHDIHDVSESEARTVIKDEPDKFFYRGLHKEYPDLEPDALSNLINSNAKFFFIFKYHEREEEAFQDLVERAAELLSQQDARAFFYYHLHHKFPELGRGAIVQIIDTNPDSFFDLGLQKDYPDLEESAGAARNIKDPNKVELEQPEWIKGNTVISSRVLPNTIPKQAGQIEVPQAMFDKITGMCKNVMTSLIQHYTNKIDPSISSAGALRRELDSMIQSNSGIKDRAMIQMDISDTNLYKNTPWLSDIIDRFSTRFGSLGLLGVTIGDSNSETSHAALLQDPSAPSFLTINSDFSYYLRQYLFERTIDGANGANQTLVIWFNEIKKIVAHELTHAMQNLMSSADLVRTMGGTNDAKRWSERKEFGMPNKVDKDKVQLYNSVDVSFDKAQLNKDMRTLRDNTEPMRVVLDNIIDKLKAMKEKISKSEADGLGIDYDNFKDIMSFPEGVLDQLVKLRVKEAIGQEQMDLTDFKDHEALFNSRPELERIARALMNKAKSFVAHSMSDVEFFPVLREKVMGMINSMRSKKIYSKGEFAAISSKFPIEARNYMMSNGRSKLSQDALTYLMQHRISRLMKDAFVQVLKERDKTKYNRLLKEVYKEFDKIVDDVAPRKHLEQRQISLRENIERENQELNPWLADDGNSALRSSSSFRENTISSRSVRMSSEIERDITELREYIEENTNNQDIDEGLLAGMRQELSDLEKELEIANNSPIDMDEYRKYYAYRNEKKEFEKYILDRYNNELMVLLVEEYGFKNYFWFPGMSPNELELWWKTQDKMSDYLIQKFPGEVFLNKYNISNGSLWSYLMDDSNAYHAHAHGEGDSYLTLPNGTIVYHKGSRRIKQLEEGAGEND